MNFRLAAPLITLLIMVGCVKIPIVELVPGAGAVLVAKSDPGDNYEMIGPVSGSDGEGCGGFGFLGTYERAMTILRNQTQTMGGNYAQIISLTEPYLRGECFDNEYVIRATAYKKVRNKPSPIPIIESGEEKLTKQLRELKKLFDDGILSKIEYEAEKLKLLQKGF